MMQTKKVMYVLAAASMALCGEAQEVKRSEWIAKPWFLLSDSARPAVVSVESSGGLSKECRWIVRFTGIDSALDSGDSIELGPTACSVGGYPAYCSAARVSDGHWALFSDYHGGGSRNIQGVLLPLDPSHQQVLAGDLRPSRIHSVTLSSGKKALDLFKPALFEKDKALWVGASARKVGGLGAPVSWASEYVRDADSLVAKFEMRGIDMRVLQLEDRLMFFTRDTGNSTVMDRIGPVLVHTEGEDGGLLNAPAPPLAWEISTYDVTGSADTLWILGVTGDSRAGHWTGELMRLDEGDSEWRLEGTADFQEFPTCVYLQPGVNQTRPDLICFERGLLVKKTWVLAAPSEIEPK